MNAMFSDYLSHDSPATYLYAIFAVLVFKKKKIFYVAALEREQRILL